ncbi:MAG TPA: endonuclease, partial [Flavobacteriaceae bacterium]|nr:endonuclease [Flavobacteriaceae bacterium]
MKHIYLLFLFFTTCIFSQETYYTSDPNSVDFNLKGINLKTALENKIRNNTTSIPYTDSGFFDTWDALQLTDVNPTNNSEVLLIYGWEDGSDGDVTNDRERDINNYGGSNGQWNREHVFAKSLATPSLDTNNPGPGTDIHNLRASDVQRNNDRGNLLYADGLGNSGKVSSDQYWYPGDEWKGDVARIIMYMYLRYDGDGTDISETQCLPINVGVGNPVGNDPDMIDLFLQWNADDPVSDVERQRNSVSETYQNNRNPFIDDPYLATAIWGGPVAEDTWGILSTNDTATIDFKMYPNPVKNDFLYFSSTEDLKVIVYDVLGKQVEIENINPDKNF